MRRHYLALSALLVVALTSLFLIENSPLHAIPTRAPANLGKDAPKEKEVSADEAGYWAHGMAAVAEQISEKYVQPVSRNGLLAAAVHGLFAAAEVRLPDRYQGDLATFFERQRDPEIELIRARFAAGNGERIKGGLAIRAGIEGMSTLLDPHSTYLSPEELRVNNFYNLSLGQAGIAFEERTGKGPLTVRAVLPESSAQTHGILPGDDILSIGGKSTEGMSASQGRSRLYGRVNATVSVVVRPFQEESTRTVELTMTSIGEETVFGLQHLGEHSWNFSADAKRGIGYVRLTYVRNTSDGQLNEKDELTLEALVRALNGLRTLGPKGFILDLRESTGGYLTPTDEVINMFLQDGIIRIERDRQTERKEVHAKGVRSPDFPMVVLIGPDTSGAGELIAAALHDNGRAKLAGQRTRGKGSIQLVFPEAAGSSFDWPLQGHGMRLTISYFLRPNGQPIQRFAGSRAGDPWGIDPDPELEVRISPELRRQIRRWRFQQDMRDPADNKALPLDDPQKDPVYFAALEYLRSKLDAKTD